MDDRAVRPRARDAVEGQVPKLGILAPQSLQMVGGLQLVEIAFGRLFLDPAKEARYGGAIARLGRLLSGNLDRVLERLRKDRGIADREDLCSGLVQRLEDCRDGAFRIDRYRLSLQFAERCLELIAIVKPLIGPRPSSLTEAPDLSSGQTKTSEI